MTTAARLVHLFALSAVLLAHGLVVGDASLTGTRRAVQALSPVQVEAVASTATVRTARAA